MNPQPKSGQIRLEPHALKKLKRLVAKRDNYLCALCGRGEGYALSVHHIIPLARGGSDTAKNMRLECCICHGADHGIKVVLHR